MKNLIHAFEIRGYFFELGNVGLDQGEIFIIFMFLKIFRSACGKIIKDDNLMTISEQTIHHMAPDKTRSACH